MESTKVLFIFFQTSNKANGGLNSLAEIILNLNEVRPIILTNKYTDFTKRLEQNGIKVIVKPVSFMSGFSIKKIKDILNFSKICNRMIIDHDIHALHINDIRALLYLSPLLYINKINNVFNIRDVHEKSKPYGMVWKLINLCNKILVLSEHMEYELASRLPINKKTKHKIEVTYSTVDFKRFQPINVHKKSILKEQKGFDNFNIHCLYIAAFNEKKNQLDFIEKALPLLKDNNIVIHFIGDFDDNNNPYVKKCLLALKAQHKNKVVFQGYQSEIESFYKIADLTLVPTRREGMARCMIESLSSGVPVISFDVSSAKEILENRDYPCGIVVEQGDYIGMIEQIKKLLADKNRYSTYSKNGIDLSRKLFDKEKVVKVYENAYLS